MLGYFLSLIFLESQTYEILAILSSCVMGLGNRLNALVSFDELSGIMKTTGNNPRLA
jgi:hypothetical protein